MEACCAHTSAPPMLTPAAAFAPSLRTCQPCCRYSVAQEHMLQPSAHTSYFLQLSFREGGGGSSKARGSDWLSAFGVVVDCVCARAYARVECVRVPAPLHDFLVLFSFAARPRVRAFLFSWSHGPLVLFVNAARPRARCAGPKHALRDLQVKVLVYERDCRKVRFSKGPLTIGHAFLAYYWS